MWPESTKDYLCSTCRPVMKIFISRYPPAAPPHPPRPGMAAPIRRSSNSPQGLDVMLGCGVWPPRARRAGVRYYWVVVSVPAPPCRAQMLKFRSAGGGALKVRHIVRLEVPEMLKSKIQEGFDLKFLNRH